MAENILGILLVANSTKERYIFRYPPDATSPLARLSNPIYSKETMTAKDPVPDKPAQLFGHRRRRDSRFRTNTMWSSNASGASVGAPPPSLLASGSVGGGASAASHRESTAYSSRLGHGSDDGSAMLSLGGSMRERSVGSATMGSDRTSSSSSTGSDSDSSDGLYDVGPMRRSIRSLSSGTEGSRLGSTPGSHAHISHGLAGLTAGPPKPFTEIVESDKTFRRHSTIDSDVTAKERRHRKRLPAAVIEAQYNSTLGYSLDFLADLLSPPRSSCHKKFEVTVDEIVFIGHPVCCGPDGKWAFPSDEEESDDDGPRRTRGRRMHDGGGGKAPAPQESLTNIAEEPRRQGSATLTDGGQGGQGGMEVLVSPDATSPSTPPSRRDTAIALPSLPPPNANAKKDKGAGAEDDVPQLQMFHLVLIVDKPDPRPGQDTEQLLEQVYREIAFKWSAAAFAMQVRANWVARQARDLARIREKDIAEGVPVDECLRECIEKTEMAASLHEVYGAIHHMRTKPLNTLFERLPVTATIHVASIPITIVFPPRGKGADSDPESSDSSDSDDEWNGLVVGPSGELVRKLPEQAVHPWQTLLILDDDDAQTHRKEQPVRRDSRSEREQDELVRSLIRACDISKPLHEIAHLLRYDLEGIVFPLVRELVQARRAILVDVVNVRLRTILAPTSISEHVRSLHQHSIRFQFAFPTLPPLLQFVAMVSAEPVPFRDLLPPDAQADTSRRDPYLRAVTWLLKNDLVRQLHVYARVIASSAVKEAAWRKLWQRRRARWLRIRKASMTSSAAGATEAERPKRPSISGGVSGLAVEMVSPKDQGYAARVPRSPLVMRGRGLAEDGGEEAYDSELEMDSDMDVDGGFDADAFDEDEFEASAQPSRKSVPKFSSSFILKPAKAQKDEQRWLRVIREQVPDPILQSRFDLCVQYFDGVTSFEEIMYRTSLSRREVDRIAHVFREHVMISIN